MVSRTRDQVKGMEAFRLGQRDARQGDECIPEAYFSTRWQREQYAKGYASIRVTLNVAAILGLSFVPAGGAI